MPPLIRNVSDTARWVAVYRANETDRADAVFRDPFARKLAGERGEEIYRGMRGERSQWPFVARTSTFDEMILNEVRNGADMVVNLAAGLDARPYRLTLPKSLTWIEIDLPEILEYKERILKNDVPVCTLERIRLDLADVEARRGVFDSLARRSRRTLIVSEGLLIYLDADQVSGLARDLAGQPPFQRWISEIASPGLLKMMQRTYGTKLSDAGAPFKFAPEQGPDFFGPLGWHAIDVRSMMRTARQLGRLPWMLRLFAMLPEPKGSAGKRPWSGVCLLAKS